MKSEYIIEDGHLEKFDQSVENTDNVEFLIPQIPSVWNCPTVGEIFETLNLYTKTNHEKLSKLMESYETK